ncbi:uncharacterized protein [Eleutherodactylus coqui]|uniref:uncharacterized protein n=1 Tax=Eleutherodactylus coqui TaxID=57060 RepID=UPI0034627B41
MEIQKNSISFLDVQISKTNDGLLQSSLYRKPTASNSLLAWDSAHPYSLKNGIPKGQFLRLRRNCSDTRDFEIKSTKLKNRFINRGYPSNSIERAYQFSKQQNRPVLLVPKIKNQNSQLRIISTFDNGVPYMRNILFKYWGILQEDPDLKAILPPNPLLTFRRGRNIKDRVVKSHLRTIQSENWLTMPRPKGTFPCSDCLACRNILKGDTITSAQTGKTYTLREFFNCRSSHLVYMATCPCKRNYIGKTRQEFRRRIIAHIGNIRRGDKTPVANHMRDYHGGDPDLKFQGVESIRSHGRRGDLDRKLLQKESQCTYRIDCLQPKGLNENLSFACFI